MNITIDNIEVIEWGEMFKATIISNIDNEPYTFEGTLDEVYQQIKESRG